MSGMGPASCWVTHKRLESWAKAAKERALGTTSPKHSENGSNSNSSNNSLEVCFYSRCLQLTCSKHTYVKITRRPCVR